MSRIPNARKQHWCREAARAQGCAKFHFQIGQASANFMPSPNNAAAAAVLVKHSREERRERWAPCPSSNVINVDLAVALAVVLAEVEADAALLLAAVGVGLVDLGGLGELAVGLE